MMHLTLYFDGAVEPVNPGGLGSYGWLVQTDDGRRVMEGKGSIGSGPGVTNNVAEYHALGFGLRALANAKAAPAVLVIRGDSQLVVYQLTGAWRCNVDRLVRLRDRCRELLAGLGCGWRAEWVPRAQNEAADALSRAAWCEATGKPLPERRRAR